MSFNPDKTEIMIFSNRSIPENLDFSFNGKSVPITTSHKYLGVTFSNDAKWNTHVDNIQSSVSKNLNIIRRLKYRLSCTNLDKLYLVYIRPLFEYACELWDNCGIGNSQKLEQLQLEAARIVTGLPIFTKTEILYIETTGTCFIQKIYAPSSSLLQGKHLPFSPSTLRLNIFCLFVILSLTQLYRYTPEIFLFSTATFKYT